MLDWPERAPRCVAFDGESIFVASGRSLFEYDRNFDLQASWRNTYLANCNSMAIHKRVLYLVSTSFDAVLGFDLDKKEFDRGFHFEMSNFKFGVSAFDLSSNDGPLMLSKLSINSIYCDENGMYLTGLQTGGMLHFNGEQVNMSVEIPVPTNDARPFRNGVLFTDAENAQLCYSSRGDEERTLQGVSKGLCVLSGHVVAGGASPASITLWDLAKNRQLLSVALDTEESASIQSVDVWPFD